MFFDATVITILVDESVLLLVSSMFGFIVVCK